MKIEVGEGEERGHEDDEYFEVKFEGKTVFLRLKSHRNEHEEIK